MDSFQLCKIKLQCNNLKEFIDEIYAGLFVISNTLKKLGYDVTHIEAERDRYKILSNNYDKVKNALCYYEPTLMNIKNYIEIVANDILAAYSDNKIIKSSEIEKDIKNLNKSLSYIDTPFIIYDKVCNS